MNPSKDQLELALKFLIGRSVPSKYAKKTFMKGGGDFVWIEDVKGILELLMEGKFNDFYKYVKEHGPRDSFGEIKASPEPDPKSKI